MHVYARAAESLFKRSPVFCMKVLFTFLHLSKFYRKLPKFCIFDNKVSTQKHFESRLFCKNAEKLRIHASLEHPRLECQISIRNIIWNGKEQFIFFLKCGT